jgi:hypothetical protein
MKRIFFLLILIAPGLQVSSSLLSGQDRIVKLAISAEDSSFKNAVQEYRAIWDKEGARIVGSMESATGLRFEEGPIPVVVYEGPSNSGFRDRPMRLRASYPEATKRGTLVHELAHRLISELVPKEFEDHPIIFLFVYDVWVELWGKTFADEQVAIESQRRGLYDYETAWKNTQKLTHQERAARFKQFLADHPPQKD